jgi:hypothetical protein
VSQAVRIPGPELSPSLSMQAEILRIQVRRFGAWELVTYPDRRARDVSHRVEMLEEVLEVHGRAGLLETEPIKVALSLRGVGRRVSTNVETRAVRKRARAIEDFRRWYRGRP